MASIFLHGCHNYNKRPHNLIPQNKYINLLIELQLLKSYQLEQHPDSAKVDSIRKAIFAKYSVTKDQFEKSHRYYRRNVNQQSKRIQEAITRLNQDRMTQQDSLAQKDSVNKR